MILVVQEIPVRFQKMVSFSFFLFCIVFTQDRLMADTTLTLVVPETIAPSSVEQISVEGGVPPYAWSTCGHGVSVENKNTTGQQNNIQTDGTSCGSFVVKVSDFSV